MGFYRPEYWIGLPFPPPVHLLNPGIEPWSPALQADLYCAKTRGLFQAELKLVSAVFSFKKGCLYTKRSRKSDVSTPGFTSEEEKPRPGWEVPELGQGLPEVARGLWSSRWKLFSWVMLFLCRFFSKSHFSSY